MKFKMNIDRRGFISINNRIVCNRMGLTPEMTINYGDGIQINTKNYYTVSKMSPGIVLSFYSVDVREITNKNLLDLSWFQEGTRVYFLSTLNKIDGWRAFWKGRPPFGEMLSKKYLASLSHQYAWTFFLLNESNAKSTRYTLSLLWDIENQIFITPDKWPKYLNPEWKEKTTWSEKIFLVVNNELKYISAATKWQQYKFSLPDFEKIPVQSTATTPRIINVVKKGGVPVELGAPLLITIYNGDQIFTCKIIVRDDIQIGIISNRSQDKFEALLIARFRGEDTTYFEKKYFTTEELIRFEERLKIGKKIFFKQIFEKVIMKKYITFPDKIYNTLQLGKILSAPICCGNKQEEAWSQLQKCRGWKTCAVSSFYLHYVK